MRHCEARPGNDMCGDYREQRQANATAVIEYSTGYCFCNCQIAIFDRISSALTPAPRKAATRYAGRAPRRSVGCAGRRLPASAMPVHRADQSPAHANNGRLLRHTPHAPVPASPVPVTHAPATGFAALPAIVQSLPAAYRPHRAQATRGTGPVALRCREAGRQDERSSSSQ